MIGWRKLLLKSKLPELQGTGKICVPEEIRQMASNAAKCRDPVRRRYLRKIAQKLGANSRRAKRCCPEEGDQQACGHEALGQRSCQRRQRRMDGRGKGPLRTLLRRQRNNSEVQAERILSQSRSGDRCVALQGSRVMITVDKVLRARRKMPRNKGQWSSRLPSDGNAAMSSDGAQWFDKCFRGECRALEA